jgi:hypothetical protein
MGLLDDTTHQNYYQSNTFGNYQFTSLDDIITQFQIAYVGEGKIIQKVKRADIAFHAQRGLQEFSFDTFKSIKSQQIDLPPTLVMPLPHDYVNYTKLSWADSSGIKHLLYPTNSTSNPFQIRQQDDGKYFFGKEDNLVVNGDFANELDGTWTTAIPLKSKAWDSVYTNSPDAPSYPRYYVNSIYDTIGLVNEELEFGQLWFSTVSRAYGAWQEVSVSHTNSITLQASGLSGAQQTNDDGDLICDFGVLRIGITSTNPSIGWTVINNQGNQVVVNGSHTVQDHSTNPTPNNNPDNFDIGYVEWSDGTSSQKEIEDIDVTNYDTIWVYVQSYSPWTADAVTTLATGVPQGGSTAITPTESENNTHQKNTIDSILLIDSTAQPSLQAKAGHVANSSTWNSYKAGTPSENQGDYQDDTYWPAGGERYGLDPRHAQANGSFYIDPRLGRIHFSSNISGKTVILDYISDSLGTDAEMQVHKFAEEAMYKYIAYAILSTSSQPIHQQLAPRFKKERFAETRKAKLRLSNIKLEELTQILRGKSKQIKH